MINKLLIEIRTDIQKKSDFAMITFLSSLFFTLLLIMPIYDVFLKFTPGIKDFSNHVMSAASATNLDIAARVNSYSGLLIYIVMIFCIFICFFYAKFKLKFELERNSRSKIFLKELTLIGLAAVCASIFSSKKDFAVYYIAISLVLGWAFLSQKNEEKDFDMLIWSLLISTPFALYIYMMIQDSSFIARIFNNEVIKGMQVPKASIMILILTVISVVIYLLQNKFLFEVIKKNSFLKYKNAFIFSGIPLIMTGLVQSFSLELINVLNINYNYIFEKPKLMYGLIMMIAMAIAFFIFRKATMQQSIEHDISEKLYKWYMPISMLTFSCILSQPWRKLAAGTEYFEMANHGLSVDHFFRYFKLPIVETFDAHMLSNQVFAYIYSVINGYEPWAAFLYNSYGWVLYIIPMFYILNRLIGTTNAYFFMLTFPLLTQLYDGKFIIAGIIGICVIRMISKYNLKSAFLFWIAAFLMCIYRIDLGFAAISSGIITYLLSAKTLRVRLNVKEFIFSGAIVFCISYLSFVILCLIKGVAPLGRTIEFIKLLLSNQSWAYSSVGNSELLPFAIGYYILPVATLVLTIWVILKYSKIGSSQNMENENVAISINRDAYILFIFFVSFFMINISRGIVRHSYLENTITVVLSTIPFAFAAFTSIDTKSEHRILKFVSVAGAIVVLLNLNVPSLKQVSISLLSNALDSPAYMQQYTPTSAFNGTRVAGNTLNSDANELKRLLDAVLTPKETYFDFASTNYFHALTGRENPVYVNQSPLMFNGDFTQEIALNQIKNANPPIILMPIKGNQWAEIDGISVDYKYYQISEYIYKNYTPLLRMPMFDVYCLSEKKAIYEKKLNEKGLLGTNIYAKASELFDKSTLVSFDCNFEVSDDGIIDILPTALDPRVLGNTSPEVISKFDKASIGENYIPVQIVLEMEATSVGVVQIFYTLDGSSEFSENNSQRFNINQVGKNSIVLNLSGAPYKLRIDPDLQSVKLKSAIIQSGFQTTSNQPEVWVRNLGNIPRLWAEMDKKNTYSFNSQSDPVYETQLINLNVIENSEPGPTYLLLEIESNKDCNSTIYLNNESANLGTFMFAVASGKHKYALRLSTDSHWWTSEPKNLAITFDQAVNVHKYNVIPVEEIEKK